MIYYWNNIATEIFFLNEYRNVNKYCKKFKNASKCV